MRVMKYGIMVLMALVMALPSLSTARSHGHRSRSTAPYYPPPANEAPPPTPSPPAPIIENTFPRPTWCKDSDTNTPAENIVCNESGLSASAIDLDNRWAIYKASHTPAEINKKQSYLADWNKNTFQKCVLNSCIENAYKQVMPSIDSMTPANREEAGKDLIKHLTDRCKDKYSGDGGDMVKQCIENDVSSMIYLNGLLEKDEKYEIIINKCTLKFAGEGYTLVKLCVEDTDK